MAGISSTMKKTSSKDNCGQSWLRGSFLLVSHVFLSITLSDILVSSSTIAVDAFSFQLPQIRMPWENILSNDNADTNKSNFKKGPILPGDKVLIIGGSGGIGQLVSKKLRARTNAASQNKGFNVVVTARDVANAKDVLEDDEIEVIPLNLVGEQKKGGVVASSDEEIMAAMDGATGLVITVGTTAFPTQRWSGGNTPMAIDADAVSRIAKLASQSSTLRRVVLLTSIGVERTKEMPFLILNLFGVLDAKRIGEEAIIKAASESDGLEYAIIRPGRLVGGPYTNIDFVKMFQIEGGAGNGCDVELGDTLLGDCKRDVCAEAVVQCLENKNCRNVTFCMVSNEEKALTNNDWSSIFSNISGSN